MNAVFLLSGGMDSQVLLAKYRSDYRNAHCVGFDYGQKHCRELDCAAKMASYHAATFERIELPKLIGSALTDEGVTLPKGLYYADPAQSATVVPGRNLLMLSVAIARAVQREASFVLFGAHAGDHAVYPDCRETFVSYLSAATYIGYGVRVLAPFAALTKRQVADIGRKMHVPLDQSWSCYEGGEMPCGGCGACVERAEALAGF